MNRLGRCARRRECGNARGAAARGSHTSSPSIVPRPRPSSAAGPDASDLIKWRRLTIARDTVPAPPQAPVRMRQSLRPCERRRMRPFPRLRTWYIIPPSTARAVRGMIPEYHMRFAPSLSVMSPFPSPTLIAPGGRRRGREPLCERKARRRHGIGSPPRVEKIKMTLPSRNRKSINYSGSTRMTTDKRVTELFRYSPGFIAVRGKGKFAHYFGGDEWKIEGGPLDWPPATQIVTLDLRRSAAGYRLE